MRIKHPSSYLSQFTGKAGEHAVASQLLLRGIPVHFPAVDVGVDLIAGSQIRIQVKACNTKRRDGYSFFIGGSRPRNRLGDYNYTLRNWSESADFMVCWAAPENRFWVIPTADITDRNVAILCLGFSPHWKFDGDVIRELHQDGVKGVDIARHLGCSVSTVSAVLNGRIKKPIPSFSNQSAKYEGAWGLIESCLDLADSVNSSLLKEV